MAVAVISFAGCTKDEPKRNSIGFKVASQDTKSTIYTTDNIGDKLGSFKVDLFDASDGTTPIKNINNADDLGVQVTYAADDSGTKDWYMSDITYWYDQKITAWAYANVTPSSRAKDSQSFSYTVANTAAEQKDVLYAYTANRTSKMDNGVIPIHFYHALSAIQFQFGEQKTGGKEIETGTNIKITKVTINNISKSGSCTFDTSNKFVWDITGQSQTASVSQAYNQSVIPGKMLGSEENGDMSFLLVPQTMNITSGHKSSVTIEWTKDGETMDPRTTDITTRNGETITWEPGKRYLYTIRIEKHSLKVSIELTVLPWDSEDIEIAYDKAVVVAQNGGLSFDNCTEETSSGATRIIFNQTNPIEVQFKLTQPENGTWLVSLTNSADFEIYTDPSSRGTMVSGDILDNTDAAIFYIVPKSGIDRTVNHSTKLKISATRTDGVTISADDEDLLNTAKYEIVLPARDL